MGLTTQPNITHSRRLQYTSNKQPKRQLIVDQLVRSLMLEPIHSSLSPRLGTGARTFLDLFQNFPALCVKW